MELHASTLQVSYLRTLSFMTQGMTPLPCLPLHRLNITQFHVIIQESAMESREVVKVCNYKSLCVQC